MTARAGPGESASGGRVRTGSRPRLVKRLVPSRTARLAVRVGAVVAAFALGAVFLVATGRPVGAVYGAMWDGSFGSAYGQAQTLLAAIPLVLTGLAVAVAFRMRLWNIGAEGQFYFGAAGATTVAYAAPDWPALLLLPAMVLGGLVGGALWALVPAALRAYLGINEIVPTLLLNYVAILFVDFMVHNAWRDPGSLGFPLGKPFSEAATLPLLGDTAVHLGAVLGVAAALVVFFVLVRTPWGYKVRVMGENPRAGRYAGYSIRRSIITVMLLSGALAGLGGMVEVSGVVHRIQADISPGFGYTGIIVATLARFSPLLVLLVAVLFGALVVGGVELQTVGLPSDIVQMLQGVILFFALAGELLVRYRIEWRAPSAPRGPARS
ncbi:MAG TPA: ABC transporter permease, partial [Actinomycetota bacterium]|nr:ABC transporter permease [Actinomycetota bacterium]